MLACGGAALPRRTCPESAALLCRAVPAMTAKLLVAQQRGHCASRLASLQIQPPSLSQLVLYLLVVQLGLCCNQGSHPNLMCSFALHNAQLPAADKLAWQIGVFQIGCH